MSWFNHWLALNLCKNDIFLIVSRFSVKHFLIFLQRRKKHENCLKIVSQTSSMYHAVACLTVPKSLKL